MLHMDHEPGLPGPRREAPVDRPLEPAHVEEHVDRDDDEQHDAEDELEDRDRGSADEVDRLRRVLLDVLALDVRGEVLALFADVHPLEVMRVEPQLEAVDVLLEPRLGALSVLARKVGVDPICRRLRLVADDHADGDGDNDQRSGKAEVDDRNREAARNPKLVPGRAPAGRAAARSVPRRGRGRPRERPSPRAGSRSARAREGRPAESSAGSESSASRRTWRPSYRSGRLAQASGLGLVCLRGRRARSRPARVLGGNAALSAARRPTHSRGRCSSARFGRIGYGARHAPAPRPWAGAPHVQGSSRRETKSPANCRSDRPFRSLLLVTFALTAFGSGSPAPTQTRPAPADRLLPAGQPRPQVAALHGSLRLQLPIDQSRVTAIGYHAAGDGALALDPVGRQANEGLTLASRAEALRRRLGRV